VQSRQPHLARQPLHHCLGQKEKSRHVFENSGIQLCWHFFARVKGIDLLVPGMVISGKKPPPIPEACGSVKVSIKEAATKASAAVPPAIKICAAASVA